MIAVDSSSLRRYLDGAPGRDTDSMQLLIDRREIILPPIVVTEALSDPVLPLGYVAKVRSFPILPIKIGHWERVGLLRADLLRRELKAMIPDCLIAQSCIDHGIPLITHDRDFRHFVPAGLTLL